MPRNSCLATLFLLVFASSAHADIEAPITRVVLYPGSASIERTVQIPSGSNAIEIKGLANNFDTKTLLVRGERGVRIGQIIIQEAAAKNGAHPREKALRQKILDVKDQLETLDIEVKSANLVTAYLERIGTPPGDKLGSDAKNLVGLTESIESTATRAWQRAQRAEIKKRAIQEDLEKLEFELAQFKSGAKNSRSITVQTAAETAGIICLSYQVNRAGWQPAYRAAIDTKKSTVELERLAQVSQKTGEDWTGVKLVLSTGEPQAFRLPVDPQSRGLTYYKPVPHESGAYPAAAPAPMVRAMVAARRESDDYVAPVIETQGAFATEFEVPAKVNLPADGREVAVSLGKQTHAASQRVQVTPAVSKNAVLIAEFERAEGVWLPGNIQLYRDGNYIGATRWQPDADERFTLGFGQDDLLRVNVERKNQFVGNAGFVGQKNQRQVADSYVIDNLHRNAIDVLVLESSPVSQSEEIDVVRSLQPAPTEIDWKGRPGVIAWKKQLAPSETWKIDVGYTITYPKEGSVSGLP